MIFFEMRSRLRTNEVVSVEPSLDESFQRVVGVAEAEIRVVFKLLGCFGFEGF